MRAPIAAICVKCGAESALDVRSPPSGKAAATVQNWCCPWCQATNLTEATGHLVQVWRVDPRPARRDRAKAG